jgi:aspartate aminotransferase
MVTELRGMGYETTNAEGTFYLLVRSPIEDDTAFANRLADEDVLVLPGTVTELPGWIRLSLTANDQMVEQGLAGFRKVLGEYR